MSKLLDGGDDASRMNLPIRSTFTINLTQGKQAFVDECDWYKLREFKWYALRGKGDRFYAVRKIPPTDGRRDRRRWVMIRMHREILGLGAGRQPEVDHLNHNSLDNRRRNLVVTNRIGNMGNIRTQSKHGAGIREETRSGRRRRFKAHVQIDGQHVHIGMFDTAEEAREARAAFLRERGL